MAFALRQHHGLRGVFLEVYWDHFRAVEIESQNDAYYLGVRRRLQWAYSQPWKGDDKVFKGLGSVPQRLAPYGWQRLVQCLLPQTLHQ